MSTVSQYEILIEQGLIVPRPESPLNFKFPTLLVHVPSIATDHVIDPEVSKRIPSDAELERYTK
jgi:hypothetical protein